MLGESFDYFFRSFFKFSQIKKLIMKVFEEISHYTIYGREELHREFQVLRPFGDMVDRMKEFVAIEIIHYVRKSLIYSLEI